MTIGVPRDSQCQKTPVCHYSHMALGSPSGQCHMAYIGTPVPLIFQLTMAQITLAQIFLESKMSRNTTQSDHILASFPGIPHFSSSVCVQYNTRKWKSVKNGKGLGSFITSVTSGGRDNDVRGRGPTAHSKTATSGSLSCPPRVHLTSLT